MVQEKKLTTAERIHNLELGLTAVIRKTEMLQDILSTVNTILVSRGVITAEEFNKEFVKVAEARLSSFIKLKEELDKIKGNDLSDTKLYDDWADEFEEERGVKYDREWYKTQREDHASYKMNRKEAAIILYQNPSVSESNI